LQSLTLIEGLAERVRHEPVVPFMAQPTILSLAIEIRDLAFHQELVSDSPIAELDAQPTTFGERRPFAGQEALLDQVYGRATESRLLARLQYSVLEGSPHTSKAYAWHLAYWSRFIAASLPYLHPMPLLSARSATLPRLAAARPLDWALPFRLTFPSGTASQTRAFHITTGRVSLIGPKVIRTILSLLPQTLDGLVLLNKNKTKEVYHYLLVILTGLYWLHLCMIIDRLRVMSPGTRELLALYREIQAVLQSLFMRAASDEQ
jgi:hypothetical protein